MCVALATPERNARSGRNLMEALMDYEIEVQEVRTRRRTAGRFAVGTAMFFVLVLLFRQIL